MPTIKRKIVTLLWECNLAIGPPEWQGVDSYECPECPGEGELVVDAEELEFDEGGITIAPQVRCTLCHQEMEDTSHYSIGKISTIELEDFDMPTFGEDIDTKPSDN